MNCQIETTQKKPDHVVHDPVSVEARGVEPLTSWLPAKRSSQLS